MHHTLLTLLRFRLPGYICMNEVLFGAGMDPPLLGILRAKVPSPHTFRSLILEGHL